MRRAVASLAAHLSAGALVAVGPLAALVTLAASPARAHGQQVYVTGVSNEFGRFDLLTGAYTALGTTSTRYWALTGGADGFLYGSTLDRTLHRIDPLTGAGTAVGPADARFLTGLTFANGVLLGRENGGGEALVTVDPATGATRDPRGILPSADQRDVLEQTADGALYLMGRTDATNNSWALWTLDPSTGARTLVGGTTPYRELIGLTDGGASRLFAFGACAVAAAQHCLVEIARADAAVTVTARSPGFRVMSMATLPNAAPPTTVPEPTTVALLAGGLLAIGAVARRRRATS